MSKTQSFTYNNGEKKKIEERPNKVLLFLSIMLNLLGIVFTIAQTIIMFIKKWVEGPLAIVLLVMLIINIIVFSVIFGITINNMQKGSEYLKKFKVFFGLFKGISNVVLMTMYAVLMTSMYQSGLEKNPKKIFFFSLSMIIAVLSLVLSIYKTVRKIQKAAEKKKYKIEESTYEDGVKTE